MEIARPLVIANARRIDFQSAVNRRRYSISVAEPLRAAVGTRCPVLYVLDGNWYFCSAVEAVRANAPGAVVVGIGYPDDDAYVSEVLERHKPLPGWAADAPAFRAVVGFERMYDLSLPASEEVLTREFPRGTDIRATDVGGLNSFLQVLETEVKPRVAEMVAIDPSNQAIFGHSLGGLAVLHALFLNPSSFRTFVAASPAIWWSQRAVLDGERGFSDAVRKGKVSSRVLVTMGGEEQTADLKIAAKLGMDLAEYAGHVCEYRMVENARELTERLRALQGRQNFAVEEYVVFPGQHHGISPWPALGRAVSFAFPP